MYTEFPFILMRLLEQRPHIHDKERQDIAEGIADRRWGMSEEELNTEFQWGDVHLKVKSVFASGLAYVAATGCCPPGSLHLLATLARQMPS